VRSVGRECVQWEVGDEDFQTIERRTLMQAFAPFRIGGWRHGLSCPPGATGELDICHHSGAHTVLYTLYSTPQLRGEAAKAHPVSRDPVVICGIGRAPRFTYRGLELLSC